MFLVLALALVALATAGSFFVHRGLLPKDEPAQEQQGLESRPSTLAERMADVRRTQGRRSPSPTAAQETRGPQAERRKRAAMAGGGSRGRGEGGGVRPLSKRSFLVVSEPEGGGGGGGGGGYGNARVVSDTPPSPPREDSPLLGKPQARRRENTASSSEVAAAAAAVTAATPPSSLRQRPAATGAFAGDEGGGRGRGGEEENKWHAEEKPVVVDWGEEEGIIPVSVSGGVGSDYGSEAGSRRTTVSGAPTTLSAADEALLGTFMEVLTEGLPIKIHRSSRRGRRTTLWLKKGDTLVWASKRAIGTKQWHKLKLATATSVQAGKGGSDSLIIGSGEKADEDTCFSLSFPGISMGFQAASELERDALVQGFAMLVEDLKAAADEQRYRDAEAGIIREI
ncbi:unnamed protein product [Scytosiphon promiscuus]